MRKLLIPAAAVAVALSAVAGFAADKTTTGVVKSFNMKKHSLELADGSKFRLTKAFKNPGVKDGANVTVSWHMYKKTQEADKVEIMK